MKINKAMKTILPLAAFAGLAASANAAVVTWSTPVTTTTQNDIQANASSAFNLWNGATTKTVTTTGGDVDFVSTSSGAITSNGLILTMGTGFNTGIPQISAYSAPVTVTDSDFNDVMDSFAHTGSGGLGAFSLSGLSAGTQYSVQFFTSDDRNGQGSRTISFNDQEGGTPNSTSTVLQSSSSYFIGTFTADIGGIQNFEGIDANSGDKSGILNAVTVSVVPEPSTTALLGLGGLALILRRRK